MNYPDQTCNICDVLLRQPGFPSIKVGNDEKRAFLIEFRGTRQYSKFKEVVKRFAGKCRGHEL